jgi:hypothetical protein
VSHRREHETGERRRWLPRVFTWSNGLRLLGAWGFIVLVQQPEERVLYMVGCLALATFGLPGAIRFDRERHKDEK